MKKILLLIIGTIFSLGIFAQPWLEKLPKEKSTTKLTLKDYQKAFNDYWAPFKVEYGYYQNSKNEKVKAVGWKQFKRWEWYWESQVDNSTGEFPKTTAWNEFQKSQSRVKVFKGSTPTWSNLGTNSSTGGYAGIGRLNCIAFHPTDVNIYWVGAPAGGLWKTTDDGLTWTCLTDGNNVMGVSSIIIPSDYTTSNTIYIGTGDRDAFDNNSLGILKSTDGGATWNTTQVSFDMSLDKMVTKMLLDPNDNNHIIASTNSGVYETTDGAATFNLLNSNPYVDIEYKPGDFSTLYGSWRSAGKIDYSIDGGSTWTNAITITGAKRIELAICPTEPTWVYAIASNSAYGLEGIYKSVDSGVSYTEIVTTKNLLGWQASGGDTGGQGWYDLSIAVSPTDANLLLTGGVNTWKSIDGGNIWAIANHWSGSGGIQAVHADKHNLIFRSNGDLFEVNDGGVYLSLSNGENNSWVDKSNSLVISQMYKLGVSQTTDNEVITGLQDNGTKLYSGNTWTDVKGGDGMECIIDYTDDNVQYGTYVQGQITRTTDHWVNNYTDIEPDNDGAWVTPYIMHPDDNNILYAGYQDVFKTINRGDNWTKVSSINTTANIRSMAVCEFASSTIYVADPTHLWKSNNGGTSWLTKSNLPTGGDILSLAVKSDDPNTVWLTLSGYLHNGVYQSINGGDSWTSISSGLPQIPIYTIIYNKLEKSQIDLYVGTEVGVYYKSGSADWVYFNNGLPNVRVGELEIYYNKVNPEASKLRAATYGRGLWESLLVTNNTYAPFVNTSEPTNITDSSATFNGSIVNDYNNAITESGFVYSSSNYPVIGATSVLKVQTNPVNTTGDYTFDIKSLTPNKTYYVRSYAINSAGTSYGKAFVFKTLLASTIEQLEKYGIQIFPNPTDGVFTIQIDNIKNSVEVIVKDIAGKTTIKKKIDKNLTKIELNDRAKGIYFIEINWPGERVLSKIILK